MIRRNRIGYRWLLPGEVVSMPETARTRPAKAVYTVPGLQGTLLPDQGAIGNTCWRFRERVGGLRLYRATCRDHDRRDHDASHLHR